MRLKIHTKGIRGSRTRKDNELAGALLHSVIEIDGQLIEEVTRVAVISSGDSFTKVIVHLVPGEIEYVSHTEESWQDSGNGDP